MSLNKVKCCSKYRTPTSRFYEANRRAPQTHNSINGVRVARVPSIHNWSSTQSAFESRLMHINSSILFYFVDVFDKINLILVNYVETGLASKRIGKFHHIWSSLSLNLFSSPFELSNCRLASSYCSCETQPSFPSICTRRFSNSLNASPHFSAC